MSTPKKPYQRLPKQVEASLRKNGFDRTSVGKRDPNTGRKPIYPRCSQCEVVVINGYATHETGCPNARKTKDDDDDDS